ncbi:Uncharacterised protein [Actinomyces bovis]|uniref:ABC-2 family transporter protein n=1 Tax=Actinomyces bovis TaxID=1658 RepID=A0ABY1VQ71_9ACTO|nr:hypothetical protein [Actinomyces bovis]SPT54205.1 Uncharacterised protein [Actinomyces bovis]VEG56545.1 Uncharacterised protein [Actinomyces israelii]
MIAKLSVYARSVQYRDRLLWLLAGVLMVFMLVLNLLMTYVVASSYSGETIERVSYSYLYSFSGRIGYVIPLAISAYLTTAVLRSSQSVRVHLLALDKRSTFGALIWSSVLFGGIFGSLVAVLNHLLSALVLALCHQPIELFTLAQIVPSFRMLALQWVWALIGAGLGFVFNNIAVVMSLLLVFSLFVEPTISAASNRSQSLMSFTKWLFGPLNWASSWDAGAGTAGVRAAIGLPGNLALIVMIFYGLIIGAVGYCFFMRRPLRYRN